jgi:hypothetical protein
MKIPLNTKIPAVWGADDMTTVTFEKYMDDNSWMEDSERTTRFMERWLSNFVYGADLGKDYEKYNLLREIVEERKMVFTEDMFTVYMEWAKTYIPQGKESRAKRMENFLDMYGDVFIDSPRDCC